METWIYLVKLLLTRPEVNSGAKNNEALVKATEGAAHSKVDPTAVALKLASYINHGDIVKLFFQDGRITDIASSLKRAADFYNVELIRFLISHPLFSQNRELTHLIAMIDDLNSIGNRAYAIYFGTT